MLSFLRCMFLDGKLASNLSGTDTASSKEIKVNRPDKVKPGLVGGL